MLSGLDNGDFDKTMFEVCHKPTPGTDMTFAYFHLKPYVFVSGNGAVTAGIEVNYFFCNSFSLNIFLLVNMAREFARKYKLNMKWFNAKYVWGAYDTNLSRWNGVVGHTLYGEVDVGMCNIDITYVRYTAVDYSTFIRLMTHHVMMMLIVMTHSSISPNEGRILSRKPRPTSRLFQAMKPFTPTVTLDKTGNISFQVFNLMPPGVVLPTSHECHPPVHVLLPDEVQ